MRGSVIASMLLAVTVSQVSSTRSNLERGERVWTYDPPHLYPPLEVRERESSLSGTLAELTALYQTRDGSRWYVVFA